MKKYIAKYNKAKKTSAKRNGLKFHGHKREQNSWEQEKGWYY